MGKKYELFIKHSLKDMLEKYPRLYVLYGLVKNRKSQELFKILYSLFKVDSGNTIIFAEHLGEKFQNDLVYNISFGSEKSSLGFFALMRHTLEHIDFADRFGFVPVVNWDNQTSYYDRGMDAYTFNVFEYYFEPTSNISYKEINQCRNLIHANPGNKNFFVKEKSFMNSYKMDEQEIERVASLFRRHIKLNKETKKYLHEQLKIVHNGNSLLGIHVRGTDFAKGLRYHPVIISISEYLNIAKKMFSSGKYEQIFLATDDLNALQIFEEEFGNKLLYYSDVVRSSSNTTPKSLNMERNLHKYKLGLEVLRDVYTLANCDSFICGLSQVSFAARYVNIALDRKFKEVMILDHGINNANDSAETKNISEKTKDNIGT